MLPVITQCLLFTQSSFQRNRFLLECIVTDGDEATSFLLFGTPAENFFGSLARHYVYDRKFADPSVIAPHMAAKLNKHRIFQLYLGAFRSTTNQCNYARLSLLMFSMTPPVRTAMPCLLSHLQITHRLRHAGPLLHQAVQNNLYLVHLLQQTLPYKLIIAPDSMEPPPPDVLATNQMNLPSEARRRLRFEAETEQLRPASLSPHTFNSTRCKIPFSFNIFVRLLFQPFYFFSLQLISLFLSNGSFLFHLSGPSFS